MNSVELIFHKYSYTFLKNLVSHTSGLILRKCDGIRIGGGGRKVAGVGKVKT